MISYLAGVMHRPMAMTAIEAYTRHRQVPWKVERQGEYFTLEFEDGHGTIRNEALRMERSMSEAVTIMRRGRVLLVWRPEERDEFFKILAKVVPEKQKTDAVRILRGRWAGHVGFIERANRYRAQVVVAGTTFEIHRSAIRAEM
jgi:hypothetical protein